MRTMYWYSWLRRASIDPPCASGYALLFSQNELEEADISEFTHEFLQSMGISIAKHRLNILKLATKERKIKESMSSTLLTAVSKVKRCLARCVHQLLVRHNRSAIVVVPSTPPAAAKKKTRRGAVFKRNKRLPVLQQERLTITDGISSRPSLFPVVYTTRRWSVGCVGNGGGGHYGTEEEFKWDSMFENLKPT